MYYDYNSADKLKKEVNKKTKYKEMIKKIESDFKKKLNENLKKGYESQIKEIAEKNKRELKD